MKKETVRIIDLPKITDRRGNLTFIEGNHHIPFDVRRVYFLYDVREGVQIGHPITLNENWFHAYLKEAFQISWDHRQPARAEEHLRRWMYSAMHSRLEPFKDFVRLLRSHLDGALA